MHYGFVESNTTGTGGLAVRALLRAGHDVTFFTRTPGKYPFLSEPSRSLSIVTTDTNDLDTLAGAIRHVRCARGLDSLMTFSTYYVEPVAALAEACGFPTLNSTTAAACHNKAAMRRALVDAGQPSPRFWVVDSEHAAYAAAREASYPCVVKPTCDSGSKDVRLANDADDLLSHCRRLATVRCNDRGQAAPGCSLVESFLDGPEFSVETVTFAPGDTHVVGITGKHVSRPPHFVELGHDFPADVDRASTQAIEQLAKTTLNVLGYNFGPAHSEIRLTASGPVIVEVNPRLAGGMIPELVRLASGVDLLGVVLDLSVGTAVRPARTSTDFASIRFITAPCAGRLRRMPAVEDARALPFVRQVAFDRRVGDVVRPATYSADRLGYVITSGSDRAAVAAAANQAVAVLSLDVDPE